MQTDTNNQNLIHLLSYLFLGLAWGLILLIPIKFEAWNYLTYLYVGLPLFLIGNFVLGGLTFKDNWVCGALSCLAHAIFLESIQFNDMIHFWPLSVMAFLFILSNAIIFNYAGKVCIGYLRFINLDSEN